MIEKGRSFNSKVLLFGEYTLMSGSMALSIPYSQYSGQLFFDKSGKRSDHYSVKYLWDYLQYLKSINLEKILDIKQFENDIDNGLLFETNIPISYGLGSSGAIVASIFDSYTLTEITATNKLKEVFSIMESYYHGKSSGLDPLVSYLNSPLLISSDGSIQNVKLPKFNSNGALFLLDTKVKGETEPLVFWFTEMMKTDEFKNSISDTLIPQNNRCITSFLNSSLHQYYDEIGKLSKTTFELLKPMIPDVIADLWLEGIRTGDYYLKLCGSGGGGMMLGFTLDGNLPSEVLKQFETGKLFNL